jgi:hypothetical protein
VVVAGIALVTMALGGWMDWRYEVDDRAADPFLQVLCATDQHTMEEAVEAYFAWFGGDTIPGSDPEQTLVDAGLVRHVSATVDVAADGTVIRTERCA